MLHNYNLDLGKHDLLWLGPGLSLGSMAFLDRPLETLCPFVTFGLGGAQTVYYITEIVTGNVWGSKDSLLWVESNRPH